jgi:hypothetical protein
MRDRSSSARCAQIGMCWASWPEAAASAGHLIGGFTSKNVSTAVFPSCTGR